MGLSLLVFEQVSRGAAGAHTFTVSTALWYPVDTGLFVTASLDQRVQVRGHTAWLAVWLPAVHLNRVVHVVNSYEISSKQGFDSQNVHTLEQ